MNRRTFIASSAMAALSTNLITGIHSLLSEKEKELFFKISLAQWSLHRTIRAGKLSTLDFPALAKNRFDISGVEYVNQFFIDKA